jgi:2'-5' RNA ligase
MNDGVRAALEEATETALLVLVPEADPVVDQHRRRFDQARSWGVPAHLSVVYPFVPPADVNDEVLARLASAVAEIRPFECVLAGTAWFGDEVLWLAPSDDAPFRALTRAVTRAFPGHPPYGGAHGEEPTPHLTVAERRLGSTTELRAAEAVVRERLPVRAQVRSVALLAGSARPGSWSVATTVPLGVSPGPFVGR